MIPWSDELLAWKEYALNSRTASQSPLLFVTSRGEPYIKENIRAFDAHIHNLKKEKSKIAKLPTHYEYLKNNIYSKVDSRNEPMPSSPPNHQI